MLVPVNERKNALSAVKAVEQTGDNLVLVGNGGEYFQMVKNYVIDHKLDSKIFFLQNLTIQEIAVLYQKAMIFIYPSVFEGFGIPIIEALYSKTPVITGKGSCFPEAGGPFSKYIDPKNIDEIANTIIDIKTNNEMRMEMIEKGFEYVQRFNDEYIAEHWNTLYKSL